jgi:hypothetical protein
VTISGSPSPSLAAAVADEEAKVEMDCLVEEEEEEDCCTEMLLLPSPTENIYSSEYIVYKKPSSFGLNTFFYNYTTFARIY